MGKEVTHTWVPQRSCVRYKLTESSKPRKKTGHPHVTSIPVSHLCVMPLFSIKRISSLGTETVPISLKFQASVTSSKSVCNVKYHFTKKSSNHLSVQRPARPPRLKSQSLGNCLSYILTLKVPLKVHITSFLKVTGPHLKCNKNLG